MGFKTVGKIAEDFNTINDTVKAGGDFVQDAGGFLNTWMKDRLPELVSDLAIRVVDDGSGTIANEVLNAGTDKGLISSLFK